jgi:outer membrane protein TolC
MKLTTTYLLMLIFGISFNAFGQQVPTQDLTLEQVIEMAQGRTSKTTLAKTVLTNSFWNYTAFQGSFKPTLTAEATLPDFNRSISRISLPNGDVAFTPQAYVRGDAGLRIAQTIPSLGTRIFLYSGLERLDILESSGPNQTSYYSTPISIGFSQPLFQHNENKWNQKIQPLQYEAAQKQYIEDMELIAFNAVDAYFGYYIAQLDLEATRLDKMNADSLYILSKGRYSVGRIAETDLMQIELNVKSAESAQAQAKIDLENSAEDLRRLLNIRDEVYFDLAEPKELAILEIDIDRAIELARKYRATSTSFRIRMLRAEKEVDQAQKSNGLTVNLNGNFGLSQTDVNVADAYKNLLDQERLSLNLQIPIADWGRTKAQREIAASGLELAKINTQEAEEQFEREIDIKIRELVLLKNRLDLAKSTYEVSQKRLDITRKRYTVDKVDVLSLNQAIVDKERSRQNYYSSLRAYYQGYYRIRLLTLYDFFEDKPIFYEQ